MFPPLPDLESRPRSCTVCGATPFESLRFRKITGRLHRWETERVSGAWCRDCARHHGRNAQAHTMVHGWLGFVSIPLTLVYGTVNAFRLFRAGRLRSDRNPETLSPGRSVFLRFAIIPTVIALGLLSFIPVDWLRVEENPLAELVVGDCVDIPTIPIFSSPTPVRCTESNDGVVIGLGSYPEKGRFSGGNEIRQFVEEECRNWLAGFVAERPDADEFDVELLEPPRGPQDRTYACVAKRR